MADIVTISTTEYTVTIQQGDTQTVVVTPAPEQVVTISTEQGLAPYTDADARQAISVSGAGLAYNNTTGIVTYTQQLVPIDKGGTGSTTASTARTALGTNDAANLTTGDIPAGRLSNRSISDLSDVGILDKTADNIMYTDGTRVLARQPSNWNLTDFTNDLTSGDLPAHTHAATDVTSGTFADARIPNLDTSKITTGTFADARISESSVTQHEAALAIAASQLTSGSLSIDLIPSADLTYNLGSADYRWNDIHGDLDGAVTFRAKISGGGTLAVGDVVYIDGVSGEVPTVAKASASNSSTMPAFGIVSQGGSGSQDIHVTTLGSLTGIALPSPTYTLGQNVYVSTTAGQFTTTPPTGESNLIQNIGYVAKVHASNGIIKVGGAGRTNAVPNLNSGNIFYGNGSNQATSVALTSVAATAAQGTLADSALQDVVDDTTPQLGGNLDVNGQSIVSASAGNILITPDTTGKIVLDGLSWPTADGTADQVLKTDGLGQLSFTTAAAGGGLDYVDRPTATDNTWRYWHDFFNCSPDRLQYGPTWLTNGGSGTFWGEGIYADARGSVQTSINANNDRATFWAGPGLDGFNQAAGDECYFEARIRLTDNSATAGTVSLGITDRNNALNINDTPPNGGYSDFDYACLTMDLGNLYLQAVVKDTGSAGTGTRTDLTSYSLSSYVDTWVRLGIHAAYNSTNANWDITHYINGVSVATTTMTYDDWLVPYVGAQAGALAGTWQIGIDWISFQFKIGSLISGRTDHLSI